MGSDKKTKSKRTSMKADKNLTFGRNILFICISATLIVSPSITVDAFNPPKFFIMSFGAFLLTFKYRKLLLDSAHIRSGTIYLVSVVLLPAFLVLVNSYSLSERLFGIDGRNFGAITVICLSLLGLQSFVAYRNGQISILQLFRAMAITNLLVNVVYFLQRFGLAFTNFDNVYSTWSSTLGNPNFLSAFLAISIFGVLGWLTSVKRGVLVKCMAASQVVASTLVIIETRSIQGLIAMFMAIGLYALLYLSRILSTLIFLSVAVVFFLASSYLLAALLGIVEPSLFGSQQTLIFRTVYWKIAFQIFKNSPIFGTGFDSYADSYREFLSEDFRRILGGPVISDSPHNVFLDAFVSGGLILGTLFCFVVFLALLKCSKSLVSKTDQARCNKYLAMMFFSYLGILMISPFQISIFIWLPVIMGIIIAQKIKAPRDNNVSSTQIRLQRGMTWINPLCIAVLLLFTNPYFSALPFVTDSRYRHAVESGNFYKLEAVAVDWPFSANRATAIARGMMNSGPVNSLSSSEVRQLDTIKAAALNIVEKSAKINHKDFGTWRFLLSYRNDEMGKLQALNNLHHLDPFDVQWKRAR